MVLLSIISLSITLESSCASQSLLWTTPEITSHKLVNSFWWLDYLKVTYPKVSSCNRTTQERISKDLSCSSLWMTLPLSLLWSSSKPVSKDFCISSKVSWFLVSILFTFHCHDRGISNELVSRSLSQDLGWGWRYLWWCFACHPRLVRR